MALSFILAKECLFKKADFELLFKERNRKFGSFFVVYSRLINPDDSQNIRRFGLVVAKKATGNNVKRNLVKRIIREAYRLKQHELAGLQILVVAKKDLKKIDRIALREDLCKLFKKL